MKHDELCNLYHEKSEGNPMSLPINALYKFLSEKLKGGIKDNYALKPKFQVFDGHNGNAAAIFTRENLLNHVLSAIPRGLDRDEWLHALPRALVAGFVKTDKEFQSRGISPFFAL